MDFLSIPGSSKPYGPLALLLAMVIFVLLLNGCGTNPPPSVTPTPTLTLTPTFPATLTPTPEPLGTASNPYVIGLVAAPDDQQMTAAADELARQLSALGGVSMVGRTYATYHQLILGMSRGEVHTAWMPPLTYLYASQRGIAEAALLTNHFGVYQYGVQFMANVDSGFTPYFDPISGLSSADAITALEQFRGRRPCWTETQSAAGYILPAGLLQVFDIAVLTGVQSQTHSAVVRSLYIKGVCDFGATFSISGDPRTASNVITDLPDVMNRVLIIWRSDAVIPNVNLSLIAGLSEGERLTMTNAFLDLGRTPEGRALLSLSAGNYQIDAIQAIDDDVYDTLREAARALNYDLSLTIGK